MPSHDRFDRWISRPSFEQRFGRTDDKTPRQAVEDVPMEHSFDKEMHRLPEVRRELIFRLRREIAEGTYDSDDRLDDACDRLLEVFAGGDDEPTWFLGRP